MPFSIDAPDESGQMTCVIWEKPVSSQSSSRRKTAVVNALRSVVKTVKYLLSSDVSITISWFINEDERYESDISADADNIIKPILDALCGVNGILIDDCQVQHISSRWLDRYTEPEHFQIEVAYESDAYFLKENLSFVQIENALCMPFDKSVNPQLILELLDNFEKQIENRKQMLDKGYSYYEARGFMSIQRLFHKSRVKIFDVVHISDLRKSIGATL